MIELPDDVVQEIERRAAVEGRSAEDTVVAILRKALESPTRVYPLPPVDSEMLEERKRIAEKFLTGEWSVDIDHEAFERERARDKAQAEEYLRNWE